MKIIRTILTAALLLIAMSAAPAQAAPADISDQPAAGQIGQIGNMPAKPGDPAWRGQDVIRSSDGYGNLVVVGGTLEKYVLPNGNIAPATFGNVLAFDVTGGQLLKQSDGEVWAPQVNGDVNTVKITADHSSVMIGGDFSQVNGVTRHNAAMVSLTTGAVTAWNPAPDKPVHAIQNLPNGQAVLGGAFTSVGGAEQAFLASVNQTNGVRTDYVRAKLSGGDPLGPTLVWTLAMSPDGAMFAATGNFDFVGGKAHYQAAIFKVNAKHAPVAKWYAPTLKKRCKDHKYFSIWGSHFGTGKFKHWLYFAASDNDTRGSICDAASGWEISDLNTIKARPIWVNHTLNDSQAGINQRGAWVYVTGHQKGCAIKGTTLKETDYVVDNSPEHWGICRLNATTGDLDQSFKAYDGRASSMLSKVLFTPAGMLLTGDVGTFNGKPLNDMALYPYK